MEWGCSRDCPDAMAIPSRLTDYDLQVWQHPDSSFSKTHFYFQSRSEVVQVSRPSFGAFATVGPFGCEIDEDYPEILTQIDSLSVLSNIPYLKKLVITDIFSSIAYNQLLPVNLTNFQYGGWLYLNEPPTHTDTFRFTFQFFDTEGNMFETTTEPIIITP